MNGIFDPQLSSNQLWVDDTMEQCLTAKLDSIDDDITSLESSKADTTHIHNQYADVDHTHAGYAKNTDLNTLHGLIGDSSVSSQIATALQSVNSEIDVKVDKIQSFSGIDLNTLTESGLYYVYSGSTDLHFPTGVNGHVLVMATSTLVRQVYFRFGTIDSNSYQWYSRSRAGDLTTGEEGWSQWWMISGNEKVFDGTSVLDTEFSIGSRYGCQSWIFAAQLTGSGDYVSIQVPRQFVTTNTTKYCFKISDETNSLRFNIYYKADDNNVYAKVVESSNSSGAIKFVFRIS